MKTLNSILLLVTLLTLMAAPALAEETAATKLPDGTLSGTWKAILENSYSRKQITLKLTHKDGRLRGHMIGKGFQEQKVDGRLNDDNSFHLWSTFYDRAGRSVDTTFKGNAKEGYLEGSSRFFDKPYNFTATPVAKKKE